MARTSGYGLLSTSLAVDGLQQFFQVAVLLLLGEAQALREQDVHHTYNHKRSTLDLVIALELAEEEEDEDLELVHHLFVLQQLLHGVIDRAAQGVLHLLVGNAFVMGRVLFSSRLTMVVMLRSVVKVDSISLTMLSLVSGAASTPTSISLRACCTCWSLSSPSASCLPLACRDLILFHSYLHEVRVIECRQQQMQDVLHELGLLDDAVHEVQSLVPHVLVRQD